MDNLDGGFHCLDIYFLLFLDDYWEEFNANYHMMMHTYEIV